MLLVLYSFSLLRIVSFCYGVKLEKGENKRRKTTTSTAWVIRQELVLSAQYVRRYITRRALCPHLRVSVPGIIQFQSPQDRVLLLWSYVGKRRKQKVEDYNIYCFGDQTRTGSFSAVCS